jgi:hypothetical protein
MKRRENYWLPEEAGVACAGVGRIASESSKGWKQGMMGYLAAGCLLRLPANEERLDQSTCGGWGRAGRGDRGRRRTSVFGLGSESSRRNPRISEQPEGGGGAVLTFVFWWRARNGSGAGGFFFELKKCLNRSSLTFIKPFDLSSNNFENDFSWYSATSVFKNKIRLSRSG